MKLWKSAAIDGLELKRAFLRSFSFSRHLDDRFVICLVQRGIELFSCGGTRYCARAGDIVLYQPEDVHDGGSPDQRPWAYRCFYVDETLALRLTADDPAEGRLPSFPAKVAHDPELAGFLSALHRRLETSEDCLRDQTAFLELFRFVVDRHARRGRTDGMAGTACRRHGRASLLRSRDFLEANFAEKISLEQLAGLAGLSHFYYLREFKRLFGIPPHEYQKQLRVRRAKELLAKGEPPAMVAAGTGFSDQSHLCRVFKSFTGLTPGRFRPQRKDGNFIQDFGPGVP